MPEVRIAAEPRTEFGKGPARRERRAGKVPAVLYGHGSDPRHITLPGHEVLLALRTANVLIRLEGLPGGSELALPKAVQRDPIQGTVEHVDLILVRQRREGHRRDPDQRDRRSRPRTACSTSSSCRSRWRPRRPTSRPASR